MINERMKYFSWPRDDIDLVIRDVTDKSAPILLFSSSTSQKYAEFNQKFDSEAFGRKWQVTLRSTPEFLRKYNGIPWYYISLAGILLTILTSMGAWLALRTLDRTRRLYAKLQSQARLRTAELAQARAEALSSSQQLIAMIEENPQGIALLRFDPFNIEETNRRLHELISNLDHIEGLLGPIFESWDAGAAATKEITVFSGDRWLRLSLSHAANDIDHVQFFILMVDDVTSDREQRILLDEAMARLHLASETAQIGVWYWNFDDDTIQWDQRMFEIFGRSDEERDLVRMSYQYWLDCLHPDHVALAAATVDDAVANGTDWACNYRIVCANGDFREIEAFGMHRRNEDGKAIGMLGVCRDVTARLHLETKLVEARLEAESANKAKDQFLANISHELRTPMNAIIGMLEAVESGSLAPKQHTHISTAHRAADALLRILNDILDFSRFESGSFTLVSESFTLDQILNRTLELYAVASERKGIQLSGQIKGDATRQYLGDELRISQIINNFVDNAIKFTSAGRIGILITSRTCDNGRDRVRIEVTDTGIGVTSDQVHRLFEPFVQAEASTTRSYGGSGLGLTICRQLVEAMDGSIGAQGDAGSGSTFWFEIPLDYASSSQPLQLRSLMEGKVLVYSPFEDYASYLKGCVDSFGLWCEFELDYSQVIERINDYYKSNVNLDFLIIDVQADEEQGLQILSDLLDLFRHHKLSKPYVLILNDAHVCADSHLFIKYYTPDVIIPKPLNDVVLHSIIGQLQRQGYINNPGHSPLFDENAISEYFNGLLNLKKILIVEDNKANQEVLLIVLDRLGLQAESVYNGVEAVKRLAAQDYALILMDMHMPIMSGLEATAAIRSGTRNADIPIIATTAAAYPEDRQIAFAAGMNDFIAKPISFQRLAAILLRWLPASPHGEKLGVKAISNSSALDSQFPQALTHVNFVDLRERLGGGDARARRVLEAFLEEFATWSGNAWFAFGRQDLPALRMLIHSLNGAASGVSAIKVSELAKEMDLSLKDGANSSNLARYEHPLRELSNEIDSLLRELNIWLKRLFY